MTKLPIKVLAVQETDDQMTITFTFIYGSNEYLETVGFNKQIFADDSKTHLACVKEVLTDVASQRVKIVDIGKTTSETDKKKLIADIKALVEIDV